MNKLPLTEPEIGEFAEALGRRLLRMPVISGTAGHKWLKGTAEYLRPDTSESEFIQDAFHLSVPELLLKWYPAIQEPPNALFLWPDLPDVAGAPGTKEQAEAHQALLKKGHSLAAYTPQEISALTTPNNHARQPSIPSRTVGE